MNDILPKEILLWQQLEKVLRDISYGYGYQEIRFPVIEKTSLFERSIGEVTDIVQKEMYTFEDRNGDSLTLRPEGTASCVRACVEHGLLYQQSQRLWYMGPMFRHERPQKGRYRQFYQFGVEAFGFSGIDIELELLLLSHRLWQRLGIQNSVRLEINTIGTAEERQVYRKALQTYFLAHQDKLDEESRLRVETNPLRLLDSKDETIKGLAAKAPSFDSSLSHASKERFSALCETLKTCGIQYKINPRLVRGLDYYSHTVFEWVTESLGAQGAICAGGRYDGLVTQCGGRDTPAVGFAIGLERLILLIESLTLEGDEPSPSCDIYVVVDEAVKTIVWQPIVEALRHQLPMFSILAHLNGGSFKSQFKKADKSGAQYAIVLGENEVKVNKVTLEFLREDKDRQVQTLEETITVLKNALER